MAVQLDRREVVELRGQREQPAGGGGRKLQGTRLGSFVKFAAVVSARAIRVHADRQIFGNALRENLGVGYACRGSFCLGQQEGARAGKNPSTATREKKSGSET